MEESNKVRRICIAITLLIPYVLFLTGCRPGIEYESMKPLPTKITPVTDKNMFDKRIATIRDALAASLIRDEKNREIITDILYDYITIQSLLEGDPTQGNSQEIIGILYRNLTRLEDKFIFNPSEDINCPECPDITATFPLKRKEILDNYLSGDYRGVIDRCVELEETYGPDILTPEIGLIFALSLAKNNMLKDAVNIGERIAGELEGKPDLISLRANIIDWQLSLRNRDKAQQNYEKLVDKVDEKEAILQAAKMKISMDNRNMVKDESNKDIHQDDLLRTLGADTDQLVSILREVDRLVQTNKFKEAKLLLLKSRLRLDGDPGLKTVDQALKSVESLEDRYLKGTSDELVKKEAIELIENEDYEDAIEKLDKVDNDKEINQETKKLKELAIEKLINRERNRAAKIFLMAKNSKDIQEKRELLQSSYNILHELIEKYPTSSLINKINSNLDAVKNEMGKTNEHPG